MTNYKINRRSFLSSSGSIFLLPLFESLLSTRLFAQGGSDPRRYIAMYFPNGTYNRGDIPTWYPATGQLTSNNLPPALSPFGDIASQISIYKHIKTQAADNLANSYGQHVAEAVAFLTCSPNLSPSISFDHMYAKQCGKAAIVLQGNTADQGDQPQDNGISYLDGRMVRGISNPGDLYRQLLGQIVVPSTPPSLPDNVSQSIIDSSLTDLNQLRSKLGASDKQRLDDYLAGIRVLELKLKNSPPSGSSNSGICTTPTNNQSVDRTGAAGDSSLYLERMRTFNDLIAIAFACDVTRSVSLMLDVETGSRSLPAAPTDLVYQGADTAGWNNHLVSHFGHFSGGDYAHESPQGIPRCITRDRFYFAVVADLIRKLGEARDMSGSSILDNTIVHAGFGVKDGMHQIHLSEGAPLIVGGGRNFLSPGQCYDFAAYDVADMYFTFNLKLGMGMPSFARSSKPIPI